jgi:23S rRNA (uracil1939-C5)-methyltransferase
LHRNDPLPLKRRRTAVSDRGGENLHRGAILEVAIEKLVYGGDGLARAGTTAVFVPFSAPGDRLRVRVTDARRRFARAEILEVLEPGPARRAARCRHFGVCGGCRLQHVGYEAQLAAKAEFVRESLRRLGGIDWTAEIAVLAGPEYGGRSRTTVQARRGHVGYFREATHEIVDVEECPILVPPLEEFVRSLRREPPRAAVALGVSDDGRVAVGHELVRQTVAGFAFEVPADSFSQGNRALVEDLVREATSGRTGRVAVDLYSGAGLFSLPLARSFEEVVAVEGRASAARRGEGNAAANGIANVRFVAEPVERWVATSGVAADLVLLDPPRTGAGPDVTAAVARLGPPAITYVSCDPATLARDLRVLLDAGYALDSVVALDLFPQTTHVETVAKLVRSR